MKNRIVIQNDKIVDAYKIGRSYDPLEREYDFQVGNPTCILYRVLEFDSYGEGKRNEERLHKKYDDFNLKGEWFILPKEKLNELLNDGNWITKSCYMKKRPIYQNQLSIKERRVRREKRRKEILQEKNEYKKNKLDKITAYYKPYINEIEKKQYGSFKNWIEFHEVLYELKENKPKKYHFNFDILRLNGEELSNNNITYLPAIINKRLLYIRDYHLNANEINEPKNLDIPGNRPDYYDVNILENTCAGGKYRVLFNFKEQVITEIFDDLQEAIDWRNKKTCDFIKESAEEYKDVLDDKVYNILSNFNTENIRQIKNIEHYTHDIKLYEAYLRYFT